MVLHCLDGAPVVGADGVVVEVIGLRGSEVGDDDHVRVPLVDLLHSDDRVGIVRGDAVRDIDRAHSVAPPLAEEAGTGGDHGLVVVLEQEEDALPLILGDILRLLLDHVVDPGAVFGDLLVLPGGGEDLAQQADPLIIGADGVVVPLRGGHAHRGETCVVQLLLDLLVGSGVDDQVRLHGSQRLNVHIIPVQDIRAGVQDLRIELGEDAVLRGVHADRRDGLEGLRGIQEDGQDRRNGVDVQDHDVLRVRGDCDCAVRVVGDGDGAFRVSSGFGSSLFGFCFRSGGSGLLCLCFSGSGLFRFCFRRG